jgi:hypothetical protein
MNTLKALTLLTTLATSGVMHFIAPVQAGEASSTQNLLSTGKLSETVQLAQVNRFPFRDQYPYSVRSESIQQLLDRIERHTDRFHGSLDSALDRSPLDGSDREDRINEFVGDFKEATERLQDRFDKRQRIAADVRDVIDRASRIENFMRRRRLDARVQHDWGNLRQDLNELARISDVVRRF